MPKTTDELLEEMTSEKKFDLSAVIKKNVNYPTDEVTVFLNGEAAYNVTKASEEAADLEILVDASTEGGTIADGEPDADLVAELEAKKAEVEAHLKEAIESSLTFTLKGVPPKLVRVLEQRYEREFSPKKHTERDPQELLVEKNIHTNVAEVHAAVVKIEDHTGTEADLSEFGLGSMQETYESVLYTEWMKLLQMTQNLTFANTIFDDVMSKDADFLRPSSPGLEAENTDD